MSDNPFIGDPDFPTKERKNVTQRIAFGYIPSPEDPLVLIPDPDLSPYIKEAFDFIDDGGPFRTAAQWLTEKCGRSISHQGVKRIWQERRGDPKTNPRAKSMQKQAKSRKPKTSAERKKAEIKTKLSQAKRLQTINQKKLDNWLEKDEWEAQYKADKEDRPIEDIRDEMIAAKEADETPPEPVAPPKPAKQPAKASPSLPDDLDVVFRPNPGPQTEFLAAPEREVLFGGSAGGGKMLLYQALILTPFGWRKLEDLKVGSTICSVDGSTTKIIGYYPQPVKPFYRLTFADGAVVDCCEDHLWLLHTAGTGRKIKGNRVFGPEARKIWTTHDIYTHYQKENSRLLGTPIADPVVFTVSGQKKGPKRFIKRDLDPYTLGVLLGDGCISTKNVTITSMDGECVSRVEAALGESFGYHQKPDSKAVSYRVPARLVWDHLDDLGLAGTTSKNKFIPRIYKLASEEERWSLLQGLMDTDGCAEKDGDATFCSISETLADDVRELARSLGCWVSKRSKEAFYLDDAGDRVFCNTAYELRIKCRTPEKLFHISRKKERVRGKQYQSMANWIVNIEAIEPSDGACIAVDHPSRLFITDEYVVTHNSYAMLADPMRYFDNNNFAGILFRRTNDELRELIWKSQEIYPRAFPGAKWQEKKSQWVFPSGARLWLTYLERDEDVLRYQGQAFCVASDTPVLMADLSYKAMRDVEEGDEVYTISGPRRITYKSAPQVKRCVKATVYSHDGLLVSQQLHPDTHPTALLSSEPLSQYSDWYQTAEQFRLSHIQWLSAKHLGYGAEENPETSSSLADDQIDYGASGRSMPVEQQRRGSFYPTVLASLDPRLSEVRASTRCHTCGRSLPQSSEIYPESPQSLKGLPPFDGPEQSHQDYSTEYCGPSYVHAINAPTGSQKPQDFLCDCRSSPHSHDEQHFPGGEYDRGDAPPRADAVTPYHAGRIEGGTGYTHECSRYRAASYSHPYTREQLPVEVPLELGILHIQALDNPFFEVFDVTVDKVNSYTTQGGLLNKNCWIGFDEITQYPTPFAFDYMRSRLRSTDPSLPLSVRATTNPGGPGHGWVKRMFIDPSPPNTAFPAKDINTGEDLIYPPTHEKAGQPLFYRRFIPASLYDNPYLSNDGAYEANLLALPEMQRRQLLEGDWAIADGAAFPEFRPHSHVVEPFEIPDTWRRFRSCDYGYSSYSAVHWFAIDPAYETLVVYRELYVSKHTGKDLAKAVLEQERGERIDYGVLDSSCWHQRGQVGPSIAEEMIAMGCRWRPSDRTNGARINGKNRFHEVLKIDEETGTPGIVFFNNCRQIIADLPVIPADPRGGEDINPKYASDHAYDSVRYGIMSRPRAFSPFDDGRGVPKQRWRPAVPAFGY